MTSGVKGFPSGSSWRQASVGHVLRRALATQALTGEAAATAGPATTGGSATTTEPPSTDRPESAPAAAQLVLVAGAFVLPHPEKMAKGGEDWFFISDTMRAIGVADGVGGWAEVGVDAGAYARQLMGHAREAADTITTPGCTEFKAAASSLAPSSPGGPVDVSDGSKALALQQIILERAYSRVDVRGSCTACLLVLVGDRVLASNLGDSGFMVIRDDKVVFHAPQQQHDFNFPYQIGSVDSMSDPPQAAQRFELAVKAGDLLVMGTDGLWDNCFDEEITSVVNYCQKVGMPIDKAAQVLAHYARHRAADPKYASPFAYSALQAGYTYLGGKMDDITVVLARVATAEEVGANLKPGSGGTNLAMPGAPKPKL